MRRGQAAYVPTGGLYFLPPGETLPLTITRRGIEDRGGIVLDMCSSLGWLRNRAHSQRIFAKIAVK